MKLHRLLLGGALALTLWARELSPIPLPHMEVIDLDPVDYTPAELIIMAQQGEVFSFLAKSEAADNPQLLSLRDEITARLGWQKSALPLLVPSDIQGFKVALTADPRRLGHYYRKITQTLLGYLTARAIPFELKVIPVNSQEENFAQTVSRLSDSYDLIIAPVTEENAYNLCESVTSGTVYIPTLNAQRLTCANPHLFFGGIDYDEQLRLLAQKAMEHPEKPVFVVSDRSTLSQRLGEESLRLLPDARTVNLGKGRYFKPLIMANEDLNTSVTLTHTPVVKTSLFLSQMTLADMHPDLILSTQLNYSPKLLTLTQFQDRENMLIASAIGEIDPKIDETIALIGGETRYNWLNYAVTAGVDAFLAKANALARVTDTPLQNNGLFYTTHLYEAGRFSFHPVEVTPSVAQEPAQESFPLYR